MAVVPLADFGKGYWCDRFYQPNIDQPVAPVATGSGNNVRQSFTGVIDNNNKIFTLPNSPVASNLEVFRNGVLQSSPDDYTLSGNTVTFILAPQVGDTIIAYYGGVSQAQLVSGTKNSINKIFTLPSAPVAASLQLYWNGLLQFEGADYILSGNTVTMQLAPGSTDNLIAYF